MPQGADGAQGEAAAGALEGVDPPVGAEAMAVNVRRLVRTRGYLGFSVVCSKRITDSLAFARACSSMYESLVTWSGSLCSPGIMIGLSRDCASTITSMQRTLASRRLPISSCASDRTSSRPGRTYLVPRLHPRSHSNNNSNSSRSRPKNKSKRRRKSKWRKPSQVKLQFDLLAEQKWQRSNLLLRRLCRLPS